VNTGELLADGYGRVHGTVHEVLDGVPPEQLTWRPNAESNSIAWLVWHLTRVQDDHVSEVAGQKQAWTSQGWYERFGLDLDDDDTGYGHDGRSVAKVDVKDPELLVGYFDAVHERTLRYLATLTDADLDRIVDRRWTPPVTLGVRLISVLDDDIQHAGQAAYLRGMLSS
jgi:uncharacterized damage-inducible protein DinB